MQNMSLSLARAQPDDGEELPGNRGNDPQVAYPTGYLLANQHFQAHFFYAGAVNDPAGRWRDRVDHRTAVEVTTKQVTL